MSSDYYKKVVEELERCCTDSVQLALARAKAKARRELNGN